MLVTWALFVAFLWGLTPVIHKHVLKTVSPTAILLVGGISYFVALMSYATYNWKKVYPQVQNMSLTNILLIAGATVIMSFIAKIIYLRLLKDKECYVVTALTFSAPFFTTLLSMLLLKEKVTFMKLIGVMLIVFGVIVLSLTEQK